MWRILSWNRESGTGRARSEGGDVDFVARDALVVDFADHEVVTLHVRKTEIGQEGYDVAPVAWREAGILLAEPPIPEAAELELLTSCFAGAFDMLSRFDVEEWQGERLRAIVYPNDWPPPRMPVKLRVEWSGVSYVRLPRTSMRFARCRAYAFADFEKHRPGVRHTFPDDATSAYVFRFEPAKFGSPEGFVLANGATIVETDENHRPSRSSGAPPARE